MKQSGPRWEVRFAIYAIFAIMILILFGSIMTGNFSSMSYVSAGAFTLAAVMLAALFYTSRPVCPQCGRRGTRELIRSETLGQEPAYGLVTRTSHVEGVYWEQDRTVTSKERVPVIRTTTRSYYRCRSCQHQWAEDTATQREDFSRREGPVVVEKEVVRIPCKYCGALVDPVANTTCPNCGGKLL